MTPQQLQQVKRELQARLRAHYQSIHVTLDVYFNDLERRMRTKPTTSKAPEPQDVQLTDPASPKPVPEASAGEKKKQQADAAVVDFLRQLSEG